MKQIIFGILLLLSVTRVYAAPDSTIKWSQFPVLTTSDTGTCLMVSEGVGGIYHDYKMKLHNAVPVQSVANTDGSINVYNSNGVWIISVDSTWASLPSNITSITASGTGGVAMGVGGTSTAPIITASLTPTGVTPGAYGTASAVPTYSVNVAGQQTACATVPISITASQVSDIAAKYHKQGGDSYGAVSVLGTNDNNSVKEIIGNYTFDSCGLQGFRTFSGKDANSTGTNSIWTINDSDNTSGSAAHSTITINEFTGGSSSSGPQYALVLNNNSAMAFSLSRNGNVSSSSTIATTSTISGSGLTSSGGINGQSVVLSQTSSSLSEGYSYNSTVASTGSSFIGKYLSTTVDSFDKVTGNLWIAGILMSKHDKGIGSAPTVAAGAGAGTSPTVTILTGSTDKAGWVSITTGSSPSASATVATITYNTAYGITPKVQLTAANGNAAALTGTGACWADYSGSSTTVFPLLVGSTALTASTTYIFEYRVTE